MLVSPEKGTGIILGYERTINDGLLQLACAFRSRQGIPRECLIDMLEEIADLRFGVPPSYPRACGFYSAPLFWEVFGYGGELQVQNVAYRMECQRRRYNIFWIDRDPLDVGEALRRFHTGFARGCEDASMDRARIDQLLHEFTVGLRG